MTLLVTNAVFYFPLANSTKMCYTYDSLSRVTTRTIRKLSDNSVVSTETFNYDAAGNITNASENTAFVYDINNRLTSFDGEPVSYDLDGNMLSNGSLTCTYDSANRLTSVNGYTYTYNAEDVRIRNLCNGVLYLIVGRDLAKFFSSTEYFVH